MKRKIVFTLSLFFTVLLMSMAGVSAAEDTIVVLRVNSPDMMVNGALKEIDPGKGTTPVLVNDSTLVPIRAIIESLGGAIGWVEEEQKVSVTLNEKQVELWIGNNTARVNGAEKQLPVAPAAINNRTMLPLRFVSENLGLCVNWEEKTESISISKSSDYVVIIAGEKVSTAEFNFFLGRAKEDISNYIAQNQLYNGSKGSIWETPVNGIKAGELVKTQALNYAREYKVLQEKVRENNVSFTLEENKNIEAGLKQMIENQGGATKVENDIKTIYNISLSEYMDFYKGYALINKYMDQVQKGIQISEDEIKKVYETYKDGIDQVTVRHILLSTLDNQGKALAEDKQEEARKKAEEILGKVKAGEDFATLAKQYSQDPGSKDNGGQYTFGKGQMVKEFEDWSFAAKTGDVGIVKTAYGYHVMKFEGKTGFEQVKDQIQKTLAGDMLNQTVAEWMNDPRSVVIKNQKVFADLQIIE